VLVYCKAGISRSAAIVLAFLMWSEEMAYHSALKTLRQKRRYVSPNSGFQKQLKKYESDLKTNRRHTLPSTGEDTEMKDISFLEQADMEIDSDDIELVKKQNGLLRGKIRELERQLLIERTKHREFVAVLSGITKREGQRLDSALKVMEEQHEKQQRRKEKPPATPAAQETQKEERKQDVVSDKEEEDKKGIPSDFVPFGGRGFSLGQKG